MCVRVCAYVRVCMRMYVINTFLTQDKMSREASPSSHMSLSHLLQRNQAPQYLMVVMLVAVFWFNPLVMLGGASHQPAHISGGRSLHSIGSDLEDNWGVYWAMWALKLVVTALCFGWASLRALPHLPGSSGEAIRYWRLRKQAERDVQNVSNSCQLVFIYC